MKWRFAIAIAAVFGSSHALAIELVNAPQWELLGVATSPKLNGQLIFGRLAIRVDSDRPKEILATATLVAQKLIKDRTLGAVQVVAYSRSFPEILADVAEVRYSTEPEFFVGKEWRYSVAEELGAIPERVQFDPAAIRIIGITTDPSEAIALACRGSVRSCSVGKTSL